MKSTPRRERRGRERRGHERADARLSMRVEGGQEAGTPAQIVTESQNISASGVYCHASHYLAPLSKVQLTIVLPKFPGTGSAQQLVKCEGIVVRCDQRSPRRSEHPYELACMFAGLDATVRAHIEDFVAWRNLQALRAALRAPSRRAKTAPKAARRTSARRATTRATRTARRTRRAAR